MFPGVGTVINAGSVLLIGFLSRLFIKKEIKNFENNLLPLGLLVLTLGIRETLKGNDFMIILFSVLIGALIGSYLKIEEKIEQFGNYLHTNFDSYLTATLIVITGPLAIVGPFFDVVENNIELLLIKSALDCFLVLFLTSSGGKGAVYCGLSILIYQGFFTLCAFGIGEVINETISNSIAGVGGVLLIGVGINLLGIKKIPVGNYILSLFIPIFLTL